MGGLHRRDDRQHDRRDLGQAKPAIASKPGTQRFSFEQVHHHDGNPVVLEHVVNDDHIGMGHRRRSTRLAQEPLSGAIVRTRPFLQELESDPSPRHDVRRRPDFPEAPFAETSVQAVTRDDRPFAPLPSRCHARARERIMRAVRQPSTITGAGVPGEGSSVEAATDGRAK